MTTLRAFEWTTPKGARITATVGITYDTSKIINSDGYKTEVSCNEWSYNIERFTINGEVKTETAIFDFWDGKRVINYGSIMDHGTPAKLLVAIPDDVWCEVFGDEDRHIRERNARAKAHDDWYSAHSATMRKAMEE